MYVCAWYLCAETFLPFISPCRWACLCFPLENHQATHSQRLQLFQECAKPSEELRGVPSFCAMRAAQDIEACQTRWLSVAQCGNRILEQWTALKLNWTEAAETKSPTAKRILSALRSPYVQATLEFTDYVLGDLTGLNKLFQSNSLKVHRLLPEVERVVRMFSQNFMTKANRPVQFANINVNDESKWLPLEKVYPGIQWLKAWPKRGLTKEKVSCHLPQLVHSGNLPDAEAYRPAPSDPRGFYRHGPNSCRERESWREIRWCIGLQTTKASLPVLQNSNNWWSVAFSFGRRWRQEFVTVPRVWNT